ncbi:MAG: ABC transporter permease [Planctomycetota bacterium]|nr:ABC transporter permease [Planctomycetota bacterium]
MTQIIALFVDAYRLLNARRIFWFTLILTGLVVLCFALIGINEQGIRIIAWDLEIPGINTLSGYTPEFFYKVTFNNLGIGIWLTWVATVLGLVTTSGMFPEFISTGSIDLILSKPIGRMRLFFIKYLSGLLFVILQVCVFCVGSFVVIGLRGGVWLPGIFISIPLVVLFFSYLYAFSVFFGILTRSTIAALLLTILCWFMIFVVQTAESSLLFWVKYQEQKVEAYESDLERARGQLAEVEEPENRERWDFLYKTIEVREANLEEARDSGGGVRLAHDILVGAMTVLPKTSQTMDLLERWTIDLADLPPSDDFESPPEITEDGDFQANEAELGQAVRDELMARSPMWILGTSLLFELLLCGAAGWLFWRRDY